MIGSYSLQHANIVEILVSV